MQNTQLSQRGAEHGQVGIIQIVRAHVKLDGVKELESLDGCQESRFAQFFICQAIVRQVDVQDLKLLHASDAFENVLSASCPDFVKPQVKVKPCYVAGVLQAPG